MTLSRRKFLAASALAVAPSLIAAADAKPRKLVLMAGTPSHGPGAHEFNAGVGLLAKCLADFKGLEVTTLLNGYPKDDSVLDTADALFVFADGGKGHPLVQGARLARIDKRMAAGMGLMCAHFGVEVIKGRDGDAMRDWIGGYYEHEFSVNPMWKPEFATFPDHPISRGVKPFAVRDEWYFNMRFRPKMAGVTPILTAKPTDATRDGPYVYPRGPYKHIQADKGKVETMMWATERKDGGRGVGFTGGHFHENWADDNFRKVVLNALVWVSKAEVPTGGVESKVTAEDMKKGLDPKGKK